MDVLYSQFFVKPPYPTQSFTGRTVLITGANVGLGKEAARHFTRLGAEKVILGVRNVAAGEVAKADIEKSTSRPGVCEVWEVDLASHASVLAFGDRVATLSRLDIAILNAALSTPKFSVAEGYERTLTVNVINTLLLGLLILPTLKATRRTDRSHTPHLTFIVSGIHAFTSFEEWKEDKPMKALSNPTTANMDSRYPVSKLVEILLVQDLAGRVRGSEVIVNMSCPGLVHTQIDREGGWGIWLIKLLTGRSTEVGSRTLLAGATMGIEGHGAYVKDGYVNNMGMSPWVRSDEGEQAREKVWAELEGILEGVRPGIMQNV